MLCLIPSLTILVLKYCHLLAICVSVCYHDVHELIEPSDSVLCFIPTLTILVFKYTLSLTQAICVSVFYHDVHELVLLIAVPRDIVCCTSDRDANLCLAWVTFLHPRFCHGKWRVYPMILPRGAGDYRRQLLLGLCWLLVSLSTHSVKLCDFAWCQWSTHDYNEGKLNWKWLSGVCSSPLLQESGHLQLSLSSL